MMYRVQIEITAQQSEQMHLEQRPYTKVEECRSFLSTKPVVATLKQILPPEGEDKGSGRKRAKNRRIINGICYVV